MVVHTAQGLEVWVVKALHADGQACDASLAKGAEAVFFKGAGIGFERDLGIGCQAQQGAHAADQALDHFGGEQAGRAAAQEHGVHRASPDQGQAGLQVGKDRIHIGLLHGQGLTRLAPLVRIEIAIGTLFQTPGQMHVQGQRRQAGQLQQPRPHRVHRVERVTHGLTSSARASAPASAGWHGRGGSTRFSARQAFRRKSGRTRE